MQHLNSYPASSYTRTHQEPQYRHPRKLLFPDLLNLQRESQNNVANHHCCLRDISVYLDSIEQWIQRRTEWSNEIIFSGGAVTIYMSTSIKHKNSSETLTDGWPLSLMLLWHQELAGEQTWRDCRGGMSGGRQKSHEESRTLLISYIKIKADKLGSA